MPMRQFEPWTLPCSHPGSAMQLRRIWEGFACRGEGHKRRVQAGSGCRSLRALVRGQLVIDPLTGLGKDCLPLWGHDQGGLPVGPGHEGHPVQAARAEADAIAVMVDEVSVLRGRGIGHHRTGRLYCAGVTSGVRGAAFGCWVDMWWAWRDLNPQSDRYERPALTIELQAPPPAIRPSSADDLRLP